MKPRDVSVSVVDHGGELFVMATFRLPGSLKRNNQPNGQFPIREDDRKAKQKAIAGVLKDVEFPNADS